MRKEGYLLSEKSLRSALRSNPLISKIYFFRTIGSTNDFAKKLASECSEEGALIISEEQTRGRGRSERKWISPAGTGIWMSLILRPRMPPHSAPGITLIAAASVSAAIEMVTGIRTSIKWPNDVNVNFRKTCGILTEAVTDPVGRHYAIVGIGINVNNREFPDEIKDTATSLRITSGRKISREKVLIRTLDEFARLYSEFSSTNSLSGIIDFYRERSATLGKRVRIIAKDKEFSARAIDITENGELVVEKDNGEISRINSGEVSIRTTNLSEKFANNPD